jgi:ABC-2 type transport system permease protein
VSRILTIAKKEFMASLKDRVFLLIALLFLVMSIASVYIGATTKNAELRAYEGVVEAAKAQGSNIPTAPIIYPLAILRNMIEYIIMIGAVLAIFLGFDTFGSERESGTLRLVLTRPVLRNHFLLGKLLGAGMVIGSLLVATLLFNIVLFTVATGLAPDASEAFRLIVFMILACIYMLMFYIGSLFVSIKSRDRSYGFLSLMVAWMMISFVIPQLAETQRSFVFAINNVSGTVTQVPSDTTVSKAIELFSIAVQFRHIGNDLLQVVSETATINIWRMIAKDFLELLYVLIPGIILLALSFVAVQKEDVL